MMNRRRFAAAASARSPCRSQVTSGRNSPRPSARRLSREKPNPAQATRLPSRSTTRAPAGRCARGELLELRSEGTGTLVGAIRAGPGRRGRTSANSRSNSRRSSSADIGADSSFGVGVGLRFGTLADPAYARVELASEATWRGWQRPPFRRGRTAPRQGERSS